MSSEIFICFDILRVFWGEETREKFFQVLYCDRPKRIGKLYILLVDLCVCFYFSYLLWFFFLRHSAQKFWCCAEKKRKITEFLTNWAETKFLFHQKKNFPFQVTDNLFRQIVMRIWGAACIHYIEILSARSNH